jgi:DNA-binding MarR family transcriptional regulator
MKDEKIRKSINVFLKMYFDSCKEVYKEINFERITGTQFKYLKTIHKHGKVTLTMLSEIFNASKPTINELINKLYDSKIVIKTKSKVDKRVVYISLTEIGELLATTNMLESKKLVENLKKKLTMDEIDSMAKIFDKLGVDEL